MKRNIFEMSDRKGKETVSQMERDGIKCTAKDYAIPVTQ